MWHHEHHFEEIEGMIRMTDKVSFKVPFGFLDAYWFLLVKPQLKKIFNYRFEILEKNTTMHNTLIVGGTKVSD